MLRHTFAHAFVFGRGAREGYALACFLFAKEIAPGKLDRKPQNPCLYRNPSQLTRVCTQVISVDKCVWLLINVFELCLDVAKVA